MTPPSSCNLPSGPADGFAERIDISIVPLTLAWFQVRMEIPHKCVVMNTDYDTAPTSLSDIFKASSFITGHHETISIQLDNESEDTACLTLQKYTDFTTRLTVTDWCAPEEPPRLDIVLPSQHLAEEIRSAAWKFQRAERAMYRKIWLNSDCGEDQYPDDFPIRITIRPYSEIIKHYASDEDGCILDVADTFEVHPKIETIRKAEERLIYLAHWLDEELMQYYKSFPWREFNLLGLEAACILAECLRDVPVPIYFVWQEDKYCLDNDRKILLTEDFCRSEELQKDIKEIHQRPNFPGPCI